MKKADFLKQENVPEFIKEIVRNAPDDAEVNLMEMKVGRKLEGSGCCLISSVCDVIKKKGSKDHERKNDDSI